MKHLFSIILLGSIFLVGCKKEGAENSNFDDFTAEYFSEKMKLNPLAATSNGIEGMDDKLALEMTDEFDQKSKTFNQKYLDALANYNLEDLTAEQQLSYKIMQWEIELNQELSQIPNAYMPLHQFWGTHLTMGQYASGSSAQQFKTVQNYTDWNKRLAQYIVWMDSAQVKMKQGIEKGITIPQVLAKKVIPQFSSLATDSDLENHLYYSAYKNFSEDIDADTKDSLTANYQSFMKEQLIPAFAKMATFLEKEYVPNCRTTSGIGAIENGDTYYKSLAKYWTTTLKTPEEIHQIGLDEVARIRTEMEKVKEEVGFEGDLKAFFDHVRNKKELKPFTDPQQVIDNFNAIHQKVIPNVNKLFDLQPKMAFEVRRTEAFREKSASAEYNQGSVDGSRPGVFYVPIPDVKNYNIYGDEDLFLHEAIPGHHFQISLQMENDELPDFRKFNWFGAYGEGWALYTESLGKELGLYTDPYQYFGMLGNDMHRAVRLVVDTGLHSKGWTREEAIAFSLDNEAESEASITAEIERYMAIPGQALSYKIGQLKIRELRAQMEETQGDDFDIKKFHQLVLESGVLPLTLLEGKINNAE